MRKITVEELEPLAKLLQKKSMTVTEIQESCGITMRQVYRYIGVLRQKYQISSGKEKVGAPVAFSIQ